MSRCVQLITWRNMISAGEDPEVVIPYEITCTEDPEELKEIYYYCIQVLPDGVRREICRQKLREILQQEVKKNACR